MHALLKKIFILQVLIYLHVVHAHTIEPVPNDSAFPYTGKLPHNTYHKYCKNIYSQNGEDGILEKLLQELNIKNGTFCEFGAADGIFSSNTYNLIKNHNFSGIAIESNKNLFEQCLQNYKQFSGVQVFHGAVLYYHELYNLNAWLKKANFPYDFDVLSIDIDYNDYYVWENLTLFAPKIVIIETNSYRDPVHDELPGIPASDYHIDVLREWHSARVATGCSFISAIKLGLAKGYIPVAYTGNITFVRKDLVFQLKEFPYLISNDPYDYLKLYTHLALWQNIWMTNTGLILNTAIRDYYIKFNNIKFDISWIKKRIAEIMYNQDLIF